MAPSVPSTTTTFDLHFETPSHQPPTSSALNPAHRFRPSLQKKYDEAHIVFDKTLKGHYRHGKTGYDKVSALFLTWQDDDMQCKATEVDALNAFFKDKFYFETDHYEIPSEKWQTGLNKKISEFIYDHDSPDCLILIYYAGHAYPGVETGSLKFAGKFKPDGNGDPTYFWNDLSNCLRLPACDQLVIADCCYAAKTFGPVHIGKGKFELLTSGGPEDRVPSPRMGGSFTKALNKVLVELLEKNPEGFSTSQLYREIYHRWSFGRVKPFLFDQSRRSHDKIWLRPQATSKIGKDINQGSGGTLLNLTLRLNGEPENVMMNQLALALQYIPNVDEIRFDKLYAPRQQIEDFMLRVIQAKKLRPLMRAMYAKRQLKKFKTLLSSQDSINSSNKFVNLWLDQKTHSTYDWSSAITDARSTPSFIHQDRKKSFTWPANRGMRRSNTRSWSNRLFSIDYKLSIPDHESLISRIFPRRAKTIDCTPWANGTFSPFASLPKHTNSAQQNQWLNPIYQEEAWHVLMWLAMIYVHGSMCLYMGE